MMNGMLCKEVVSTTLFCSRIGVVAASKHSIRDLSA